MSYILDALRKAERDRQVRRVPTLATAHGNAELGRWPQWVWAAALGGALAVGAVLLVSMLGSGRSVPVAVAPAPPPPIATAPAAPSPSAEPATPAPPAVERAPAPAPVPAVERPPGRASTVPRVATSPPRVAPVEPRAAPVEPSAPASSPARTADARRAPPRPDAPAVSAPGPGTAPAPATAPRATGPDAIPSARATEVPAAPPPAALASAPPVEATSGGGGLAPASATARLTLDVLVYSDVPAERLVFINGRKYVEGQAVTEDAVVEQITADGAILRQGDRRLILRPKLNPYARPGSP